jgi:hypothetical protein
VNEVHACYTGADHRTLTVVNAKDYSMLTAIGESAFKGVNRYNPRTVNTINWGALEWLLEFPKLRIIHKEAFRGASAITSLTLPEGLEVIKQQAFDNRLF